MSCEVAALPFQANANYGTWSIDFVHLTLPKTISPFHYQKISLTISGKEKIA